MSFFQNPPNQTGVTDIDLKLFQSGFCQTFYGKCDHFCIGIGTSVIHQFRTNLRNFRHFTLISAAVDKGASTIRQADRHRFLFIIFSNAARDRRRDIRTKRQCVIVLVEKFKHIFRSNSSTFPVENIEKFVSWRLNVFKSIGFHDFMDIRFNLSSLFTFDSVDIPHSFGSK